MNQRGARRTTRNKLTECVSLSTMQVKNDKPLFFWNSVLFQASVKQQQQQQQEREKEKEKEKERLCPAKKIPFVLTLTELATGESCSLSEQSVCLWMEKDLLLIHNSVHTFWKEVQHSSIRFHFDVYFFKNLKWEKRIWISCRVLLSKKDTMRLHQKEKVFLVPLSTTYNFVIPRFGKIWVFAKDGMFLHSKSWKQIQFGRWGKLHDQVVWDVLDLSPPPPPPPSP